MKKYTILLIILLVFALVMFFLMRPKCSDSIMHELFSNNGFYGDLIPPTPIDVSSEKKYTIKHVRSDEKYNFLVEKYFGEFEDLHIDFINKGYRLLKIPEFSGETLYSFDIKKYSYDLNLMEMNVISFDFGKKPVPKMYTEYDIIAYKPYNEKIGNVNTTYLKHFYLTFDEMGKISKEDIYYPVFKEATEYKYIRFPNEFGYSKVFKYEILDDDTVKVYDFFDNEIDFEKGEKYVEILY